MTIEKRNILFLDNALELPIAKKAKVLELFPVDFDIYGNFNEVQDKIKQVLTPYEFGLLQKSAKQNLDQIIEGYNRDNIKKCRGFAEKQNAHKPGCNRSGFAEDCH